jgi:hypothetical protein
MLADEVVLRMEERALFFVFLFFVVMSGDG